MAEKNFTGFTEEEEKLYSEIHYEEKDIQDENL